MLPQLRRSHIPQPLAGHFMNPHRSVEWKAHTAGMEPTSNEADAAIPPAQTTGRIFG